jgi:GLPGLI family protein
MKKIYKTIYSLLIIIGASPAFAQNDVPINHGYIDYEKKVNQYEILKVTMKNNATTQTDLENYEKNNPQFKTEDFRLYFNDGQSLYLPGNTPNSNNMISQVSSGNITYTDLQTRNYTGQKKIFTDVFLVKDTLRKIRWKITDETREIAGYMCRRANAIILDSVYVVAFYSIDIVPRGGPELFNGLPGMILGVSLPHEHVSWFAKTVSAQLNPPNQPAPPVKGKIVNSLQLKSIIADGIKSWGGATGNLILKNIMY